MSQALAYVNLTEDTSPSGLVFVSESPSSDLPLDEQIAVRQARKISPAISHIFFRRFSDSRSSQVAAYVVDNARENLTNDELAQLHHSLWLSGITPLLYVGRRDCVDILSCAAGDKRNHRVAQTAWTYSPVDTIRDVTRISSELEKARQYSAFRLADGTFWEDKRNSKLVNPGEAAHNALIAKVKSVDKQLNGAENHLARRLLLLTLFVKYLEDRGVFDGELSGDDNWFSTFSKSAKTFIDVIKTGTVDAVRNMFSALQQKFNGDIFTLPEGIDSQLDINTLRELARLVDANRDANGQLYFWDIYSFEHIPVEVLSHIYQHFAEKGKGAVFTPPLLVNLLLDQIMPLGSLRGGETVFDPTCGSGIFLMGAFKRLVYVWSACREWKRPTPQELTTLLRKTIFGVEEQKEAAEVTAFSLALAVCDALRPDIIWNELRFDRLLGRNLCVGDFQQQATILKQQCSLGEGFDIIVGNPPFLSRLTPAMQVAVKATGEQIPDKQMAYFILKECLRTHLAPAGKLCMIQPSGFLYNEKPKKFRQKLFARHQFDAILDFVSIRGLFTGADTKVIAVVTRSNSPAAEHAIDHITFRRTHATNGLIQFELDYYDYNRVTQKDATQYYWPWKANLLGGGRLYHLANRLKSFQTFGRAVSEKGWTMGEGYIPGNQGQGSPCAWLTGMRFLPTEALSIEGINQAKLSFVRETGFAAKREQHRFSPPLLLIKEHQSLPSAYWDNGDMAYRHSIIGVRPKQGTEQGSMLKDFADNFAKRRRWLQACCYLLGTRLLTGKATAILKSDIVNLPWPEEKDWNFCQWEIDLFEDTLRHMSDFVRLGQDSRLLQFPANAKNISDYNDTFLRLLKSTFPELHPCGDGHAGGLRFQAFCFGKKNAASWVNDKQWLDHLHSTVFSQSGDGASMRSVRLVRLYEKDTIIFIKPDLLRYWIKSVAIRDVDSMLLDIMQGGGSNA